MALSLECHCDPREENQLKLFNTSIANNCDRIAFAASTFQLSMEALLAQLRELNLPHEPISHTAAMTCDEQVG